MDRNQPTPQILTFADPILATEKVESIYDEFDVPVHYRNQARSLLALDWPFRKRDQNPGRYERIVDTLPEEQRELLLQSFSEANQAIIQETEKLLARSNPHVANLARQSAHAT